MDIVQDGSDICNVRVKNFLSVLSLYHRLNMEEIRFLINLAKMREVEGYVEADVVVDAELKQLAKMLV